MSEKDLDRLEDKVEAMEKAWLAEHVKSLEAWAALRGELVNLLRRVDEVSAKLDAGIHIPSRMLPWLVLVLGGSGLLGPGVAEVARGLLASAAPAVVSAPPAEP